MRGLNNGIVLLLLASGMARICGAQAKPDTSITKRAERQFQTAPLNAVPLGKGIYLFSGYSANIVAITDDATTVLVDSGIASRVDELAMALGNTTHRPVTWMLDTTWPSTMKSARSL